MTKHDKKRLAEAQEAIARIRREMAQGDNRYGSYGQSCRESIARWQIVVDELAPQAKQ